MEACSLGFEQPVRKGAWGTASQGTVLPFAWIIWISPSFFEEES